MKFKVGDWVRVKYVPDGENVEVGEIGTIVFCNDDLRGYAVEFTEYSIGKHSCSMRCKDGFGWWCKAEMLELFARCKFKAGDRVRIKDTDNWDSDIITIGETGTIIEYSISDKVYRVEFDNYNMYKHDCGGRCRKGYGWNCEEKMLEPVYADGGFCTGFKGGKIPTPEKPVPIEEQLGLPKGVSIHDLNPIEWYRPMEIRIDVSDFDAEELKRRLGDYYKRLKRGLRADHIYFDETTFKEDKPMAMFTFSTEEGYRYDKSNNTKIPTITTKIVDNDGNSATATCDKENYDERQGVLESVANLVCRGDFDKQYRKAVKIRKREDEARRTCVYCGKVFDTVEEREAEEAWHVERKKARRERYLLRKRAKEIAFEEQAQKMAKEMIKEDK